MTNNNEIINWIQDFNVNHNPKMFEGIDLSLKQDNAQELIDEIQ